MAIDVVILHAQGIQLLQDIPAFVFRQADDAGGETFTDEQGLTPGLRVGAHDGVDHFLHLGQLLGCQCRAPIAFESGFGIAGGVGMSGIAPGYQRAQRSGYCVPGLVHVGEQRVPAFVREFLGV